MIEISRVFKEPTRHVLVNSYLEITRFVLVGVWFLYNRINARLTLIYNEEQRFYNFRACFVEFDCSCLNISLEYLIIMFTVEVFIYLIMSSL